MLTDQEKSDLKARYPNHWFCKVVKGGVEKVVAIPKTEEPVLAPQFPGLGLTNDMLHGATITLDYNPQSSTIGDQ